MKREAHNFLHFFSLTVIIGLNIVNIALMENLNSINEREENPHQFINKVEIQSGYTIEFDYTSSSNNNDQENGRTSNIERNVDYSKVTKAENLPEIASSRRSLTFTIESQHSPISINGDGDLITQNNSDPEGGFCFAGSGTIEDPYIIEGLNITLSTGATSPCIKIQNLINDHFTIRHCWLDVNLEGKDAIEIRRCNFNSINETIILDAKIGIYLEECENITLSKNNITRSNHYGIHTYDSCINNTLVNNSIAQSDKYGIYLENNCTNNTVNYNTITETQLDGIALNSSCNGSSMFKNTIINCKNGIDIINSSHCFFKQNTVYNSSEYGITIDDSSENNQIKWNFLLHNEGTDGGQAYNNGTGNIFDFNHFNDHIAPDGDTNGFVDSAYAINGTAGTQDSHPRVAPIWINENSDFLDFDLPGSGTENDPYIIEGYTFITNKTLIFIQNITKYFMIRKVYLSGLDGENEGITLNNTNNGTIRNNIIEHTEIGIYLSNQCRNNTITHNTITNTTDVSIYLHRSDTTSVINNSLLIIGNCGLRVQDSNKTEISNNTVANTGTVGLQLIGASYNNSVINNSFNSISTTNILWITGNSTTDAFVGGSSNIEVTGNATTTYGNSDVRIFGGNASNYYIGTSNFGTAAEWRLTNQSTIPEGDYSLWITIHDAKNNSWAILCIFTVDLTAPQVQTAPNQTTYTPDYNDTVTVSITVSEPANAAGLDMVWLNYTTNIWVTFTVVNITETQTYTFNAGLLEY
ncbi:MAG: NosD domain-containing protein, partial [Promethearchaeota archaeon]